MTYLALDLSTTRTGWAIGDPGHSRVCIDFGSIEPDKKSPVAHRIAHTICKVISIYERERCLRIFAEESHYARGHKTALALFGLRGALLYECFNRSIHIEFLHQKQTLNAIGLKGNAKKPEICAKVNSLGFRVGDNDDEADAVAVCLAGRFHV